MKKQCFFENARLLNERFGIVPLMYGSLGLEYITNETLNVDDIDKYPYDRPDIWNKIQYLPEQIKNKKFLEGTPNSNYEKALYDNYEKLKQIKRSSKLSELK